MTSNFFTRIFFGAPDQEYRGEPSEENDRLVEKVMNIAAAGAVILVAVTTFLL